MSNNTRRPPSGGTYSNGRGRGISASQTRRPVATAQPPQQQKPPAQKKLVIETKRMWLYCGCCALLGAVMFLTKHFFGGLLLIWCAAILSPIYETIINKAEDPRSMLARVMTNRPLRCGLALVVAVVTSLSILFTGCAKLLSDEPNVVVPSATPTAVAPSEEPTATPAATPTATPTVMPIASPDPTETPEPTEEPTEKSTPTHTEKPDEEMVWIVDDSEVYHRIENCRNTTSAYQVPLSEVEGERRACKNCY